MTAPRRERCIVVMCAALVAAMYLPWQRTTSEETFFSDYYAVGSSGHRGRVEVDAWWFGPASALLLVTVVATLVLVASRSRRWVGPPRRGRSGVVLSLIPTLPAVSVAVLVFLPPGTEGLFTPVWGAWIALAVAVAIAACGLIVRSAGERQSEPGPERRRLASALMGLGGLGILASGYLDWFEVVRPAQFLAHYYDLPRARDARIDPVSIWWFPLPSAGLVGPAMVLLMASVVRPARMVLLVALLAAVVAATATVLVQVTQPGPGAVFETTGAGWWCLLAVTVAAGGVALAATDSGRRPRPAGVR